MQPKGIKAFGWGLLGFLGANFITNVTVALVEFVWIEMTNPFWISTFFVGSFVLGIYLAYVFADTRQYQATKTGAYLSIAINVGLFVIGIIAFWVGA